MTYQPETYTVSVTFTNHDVQNHLYDDYETALSVADAFTDLASDFKHIASVKLIIDRRFDN